MPPKAPSRTRVLIVDDYKMSLSNIRTTLRRAGYTAVDEALSVGEALEKLQKTAYDLVLADWNMEPVDGMTFLRQVREQKKWENLPFILMTATTHPENIAWARQENVSTYLIKPFEAAELRDAIKRAFQKHA